MKNDRVKAKYVCKQTELYAVVATFIQGVLAYQARFAAHNLNYTAAQMAVFQTFFDTVKAMPNFQQRNEPSETLRVTLKAQSNICLTKWRALRTYIERAFKGDMLKPKLEAAGWGYLPQASAYNWEDLNELLESGIEFLNTHEAALSTLEAGMPPTFKAAYEAEFNTFSALFSQIPGSVLDQRIDTDEKVTANNQLYEWVITVGKDANVLFTADEEVAIRERFVFSKVLDIVSSSGPAKLVGKVTDTANNPLSDVDVILETLDVEITTDASGNYDSGSIPSGTYKLKFLKTGYVAVEMELTINKGVTKTQNAVMAAL